jgi:hypothetical protein
MKTKSMVDLRGLDELWPRGGLYLGARARAVAFDSQRKARSRSATYRKAIGRAIALGAPRR